MSTPKKILLIGEDYDGLMLVNFHLQNAGHQVLLAWNNYQAMEYMRREQPDLVILDRSVLEGTGLEMCSTLRQMDDCMGLMVISSQNNEELRVKSFEAGADDYLLKPYNPRELILRTNAMLRRAASLAAFAVRAPVKPPVMVGATLTHDRLPTYGMFEIDVQRRLVYKNGREIELTRLEFDLLKFLYENKGFVLSRDRLLESVWKYNHSGDERVVDVVMARLRRKLEDDPNAPHYIQTIRGVGYRYVA